MRRVDWFVVAILAASWLIGLAIAFTEPVNRDEHMYLAAASFVGEARLYEDVAFFQPPYSAWMYAAWRAITPGDAVLLPARLLKALLAAGLVLGLFRLLGRLGATPVLAALLVLLALHTGPVRGVVGLARNYDPAQLVILGALLLLPLRVGDEAGRFRLLGAGALAGVSVGFKLTYAAPALLIVAWPLIAPAAMPAGRAAVRWTMAGAALGLSPFLVLLAVTDPAATRFDLVDYHLLNAQWNVREGLGVGLDPRGKLGDLRRFYRHTDLATLTVLTTVAAGIAVARGRVRWDSVWRLVTGLFAAAVVMVAVPRPVQPAYYVPLLLAATMVVASSAACLEPRLRRLILVLAGLSSLVGVVHHGSDNLRRLGDLPQPASWPAVRLRDAGRAVADLTADRPDLPVVSTHPLYVLEAGRPLARPFASGEFAWRLDDLLGRATRERFQLVTPQNLGKSLVVETPSAIVLEETAPWDGPLGQWARQSGWRAFSVAGGVEVWLPPDLP